MRRWKAGLTAREEVRNARERAMELVRVHARRRQDDVDDSLTTPRLAALMAQQYSMGVLDTFTELYGDRAAAPLRRVVEREVIAIDPAWRIHAKERWAAAACRLGVTKCDDRARKPSPQS